MIASLCYLYLYSNTVTYQYFNESVIPIILIPLSLGLIIILVPWEKVTSLKVGEIAVTLEQPKVKGAIAGLTLVNNKIIEGVILAYSKELDYVKGSKILWIDNNQFRLGGIKRLLRALGANIFSAISEEDAIELLTRSNDFDLIISNVYNEKHPNFIFNLRSKANLATEQDPSEDKCDDPYTDKVITNLPVIFFSALDMDELNRLTEKAREISEYEHTHVPRVCNRTEILFSIIFEELSKSRSIPRKVESNKPSKYNKPRPQIKNGSSWRKYI